VEYSRKYRWIMFFLLLGATISSVVIWRMRGAYTGTRHYAFLIWNLFLAWIPFVISYFIYAVTLTRKHVYLVIPVGAFCWLVFFPNAPYILTDFQHLTGQRSGVPIWYDVMMLIWFAFTGLMLGAVSLHFMQEVVRREFGRGVSWVFALAVIGLSAVGVYMGRFLRWNSWDVLRNPTEIASQTVGGILDPSPKSIEFTGLFAAFFLFFYVSLHTFGHLLSERRMANDQALGKE
jgi:uncharacterized membrane protein